MPNSSFLQNVVLAVQEIPTRTSFLERFRSTSNPTALKKTAEPILYGSWDNEKTPSSGAGSKFVFSLTTRTNNNNVNNIEELLGDQDENPFLAKKKQFFALQSAKKAGGNEVELSDLFGANHSCFDGSQRCPLHDKKLELSESAKVSK